MTRSQLVVPVVAVLAVCVMMTASLPAQSSSVASNATWVTPRTAWGDPDLQGIWPASELIGVPLQRDPALGTRAYLTDEEFAQRQKQASRQAEADGEEFAAPAGGGGDGTGPPNHWLERGTPQRQASLIVDPPNGRMPAMTPDGERRAAIVHAGAAQAPDRSTVPRISITTIAASRVASSARSRQWSTTTAQRSCRALATWPSASR